MSKLNLWNTISLAQTGRIKLLDSGRQLFGTVVKHGVNDKTVTVRVSSRHHNSRYKKFLYNSKNKQVHDQHNYCVTGDKVIIANCNKLSATKAYYIKSIVQPFPRGFIPKGDGQLEAPIAPLQNSINATDRQQILKIKNPAERLEKSMEESKQTNETEKTVRKAQNQSARVINIMEQQIVAQNQQKKQKKSKKQNKSKQKTQQKQKQRSKQQKKNKKSKEKQMKKTKKQKKADKIV